MCRVVGHADAGGGICNGSGGEHGVCDDAAEMAASGAVAAAAAGAQKAAGGGEGVQQACRLPPAVVAAFKDSVT